MDTFPIKVKDNAGTRKRYGVHAGQELEVLDVERHGMGGTFIAECEDEHIVRIRIADADLI